MTKKGAWIIQYVEASSHEDSIVAYDDEKEAVAAAADFVASQAKEELERFEWEPDDEAPKKLAEILGYIASGKPYAAITEWLDYQHEFDPEDKIAIGPSGSVSDSPFDFVHYVPEGQKT